MHISSSTPLRNFLVTNIIQGWRCLTLITSLQNIPDLCWELAQLQDTYILQGADDACFSLLILCIYNQIILFSPSLGLFF